MQYDLVYYGVDMPRFVLSKHYEKNAAWAYLSFMREGDSKFSHFGLQETGTTTLLSTEEMDDLLNKHYTFRVTSKSNTDDDFFSHEFDSLHAAQMYLTLPAETYLEDNYTSYIEYTEKNWRKL